MTRLPNPNAWLIRELELSKFLALMFPKGYERGEIWLLNNDLALWADPDLFVDLYCDGVFDRYADVIARIQIVLPDALYVELFGTPAEVQNGKRTRKESFALDRVHFRHCLDKVHAKLKKSAPAILQKLHFAKMGTFRQKATNPILKDWLKSADQTWVFYVRGEPLPHVRGPRTNDTEIKIPPRRAAVLVRPLRFPFKGQADKHIVLGSFYHDADTDPGNQWNERVKTILDLFNVPEATWAHVFRQLCIQGGATTAEHETEYTLIGRDDVAWVTPMRRPLSGPPVFVPGERIKFGLIVANMTERRETFRVFDVGQEESEVHWEDSYCQFKHGKDPVILAECPQGQVSAALFSQELLRRYRPERICVLGSCGGFVDPKGPYCPPSKRKSTEVPLQLGDVIVVSHVLYYDPRKEGGTGPQHRGGHDRLWWQGDPHRRDFFLRARHIDEARVHVHLRTTEDMQLLGQLRAHLEKVKNSGDGSKNGWKAAVSDMEAMTHNMIKRRIARVWVGQMLSGSELIERDDRREALYETWSHDETGERSAPLLGFEMEIAGAVTAVKSCAGEGFPILAIKGVMDNGTECSRNLGEDPDAIKRMLQKMATRNSVRVFKWLLYGTEKEVCTSDTCIDA